MLMLMLMLFELLYSNVKFSPYYNYATLLMHVLKLQHICHIIYYTFCLILHAQNDCVFKSDMAM